MSEIHDVRDEIDAHINDMRDDFDMRHDQLRKDFDEKHAENVKTNIDLLKAGALTTEQFKNLHECVDRLEMAFSKRMDGIEASLNNFKVGLGQTVQDSRERIVVLETHFKLMEKIMWGTMASVCGLVFGGVFYAVWKLIIR